LGSRNLLILFCSGRVDNAGHKVMAGMRARQTPGVFSVTNDLLVASEVQQS